MKKFTEWLHENTQLPTSREQYDYLLRQMSDPSNVDENEDGIDAKFFVPAHWLTGVPDNPVLVCSDEEPFPFAEALDEWNLYIQSGLQTQDAEFRALNTAPHGDKVLVTISFTKPHAEKPPMSDTEFWNYKLGPDFAQRMNQNRRRDY